MHDREIDLIAKAESTALQYEQVNDMITDEAVLLRGILYASVAIARMLYNTGETNAD